MGRDSSYRFFAGYCEPTPVPLHVSLVSYFLILQACFAVIQIMIQDSQSACQVPYLYNILGFFLLTLL